MAVPPEDEIRGESEESLARPKRSENLPAEHPRPIAHRLRRFGLEILGLAYGFAVLWAIAAWITALFGGFPSQGCVTLGSDCSSPLAVPDRVVLWLAPLVIIAPFLAIKVRRVTKPKSLADAVPTDDGPPPAGPPRARHRFETDRVTEAEPAAGQASSEFPEATAQGSAPGRVGHAKRASRRSRWGMIATLAVLLPICLAWSGLGADMGWQAYTVSSGGGTHGVWTATSDDCDSGGCTWHGTFVPAGGGPGETGVTLETGSPTRVGDSLAVIVVADLGSDQAYTPGSNLTWFKVGGWAIMLSGIAFGAFVILGVRRTFRRPVAVTRTDRPEPADS